MPMRRVGAARGLILPRLEPLPVDFTSKNLSVDYIDARRHLAKGRKASSGGRQLQIQRSETENFGQYIDVNGKDDMHIIESAVASLLMR